MIACHTHTSAMTKLQTQRRPQDNSIDSQMEVVVERFEAECDRIPRPYAGDHRLTESDSKGLLHTWESVRNDHAGMQSRIEELSCTPAAPPNDILHRLATCHTSVPKGWNEVEMATKRLPTLFGYARSCAGDRDKRR